MWDLIKLAAAVIGGAILLGAAAYVVKGIIDKRKLQEAMKANDFQEAFIEMVDRNAKKVKLKDLRRGKTLEVTGDGISSDIHEGDKIYA